MASKITDLIKTKSFTYSCEVTPDVDIEELKNFNIEPTFYSVTWHARVHQCTDLDIAPLEIAYKLKDLGKHVLLHLSCELLKKSFLTKMLLRLQEKDIRNLFIVLGENYDAASSDFKNSSDLIKHIRNTTENYFCIGVAGYPQSDDRMIALKNKTDSGADFIITQAFFESNIYVDFITKCKEMGIFIPILPGIYVFETTLQLNRFTDICKVKLSKSFIEYVKKTDEKNISGYDVIKNIIKETQKSTIGINHFHFFTLNKLQNIVNLLKEEAQNVIRE